MKKGGVKKYVIAILSMAFLFVSLSVYSVAIQSLDITDFSDVAYTTKSNIVVNDNGELALSGPDSWFDMEWKYRKPITVTNSGEERENYQIQIIVSYDELMNADFSDVRFTSADGDNLSFWLESVAIDNSGKFWVNVDSLAANDITTIYIYYGNEDAVSASNGEDTFLFFDDFNDNEISTDKWLETDISSNEIREEDGKLVFERLSNGGWNKGMIVNQVFDRSDILVEYDYRWDVNNSAYDAIMFGWHDSSTNAIYRDLVYAYYNSGSGSSSTVDINVYEDGSSRGTQTGYWEAENDYLVRIRVKEEGGAYYEQSEDGEEWLISYDSSYSTETDIRPGWSFYSGTHFFDNVRVRPWMEVEPAFEFGTLETRYSDEGLFISDIIDTYEDGSVWGTLSFTISGNEDATVKVRTSNSATMLGATSFDLCDAILSINDISSNNCVLDGHRYIQYYIKLEGLGVDTPVFESIAIEFEELRIQVQADAGPDLLMVPNKSVSLDGSGSIANETTSAATYTSDDLTENEEVTIYLTIMNKYGEKSTDEVKISILSSVSGGRILDTVVGVVSGRIVYERDGNTDEDKKYLDLQTVQIELPSTSTDYSLAETSSGHLVIGSYTDASSQGVVYLFKQSLDDLSGMISLDEIATFNIGDSISDFFSSKADYINASDSIIAIAGNNSGDMFGKYINTADIDGDGLDEIIIGAPGSLPYGRIYVFDALGNLESILVGTADYPLHSMLVGKVWDLDKDALALGPDNSAVNSNLINEFVGDVSASSSVMLIKEDYDLSGITIMDDYVIGSRIEVGNNYHAMLMADINNDEKEDVIISDQGGNVHIYLGHIDIDEDYSVIDADIVISGGCATSNFGHSLAVGELNGDGYKDLIIGSPECGEFNNGALYIIFGEFYAGNNIDINSYPRMTKITGTESEEYLGYDILLADSDANGTDEIFTVKASGAIQKYDFMSSVVTTEGAGEGEEEGGNKVEVSSAATGGCSLSTQNNVQFVYLIITLLSLAILVVFRKKHFSIKTNN